MKDKIAYYKAQLDLIKELKSMVVGQVIGDCIQGVLTENDLRKITHIKKKELEKAMKYTTCGFCSKFCGNSWCVTRQEND